jgi:2-polyprenyl-3-methyl-5-hydroxy-6-metoxy-1,4-benzoquinol methylase
MDKETQQKLLNIVKEGYEEIAEDFSETRKKYLWPELVKLAGLVKDGDSVLDAGCGNGRLVEALKNKQVDYLGVDNSEKLISLARGKYGSQNFKFLVGDILELDKKIDKKFDFIFCIAVLHHIPGNDLRVKALEQLKSKIKPGGKIILTVWNLWNLPKFKKLIFKFMVLKLIGKNRMDFGDILFRGFKLNRERYYHAFSQCELKGLFKKSGLKIIKLYKDKYNYYAILK